MAFRLIAQSQVYSNLSNNFQVVIYENIDIIDDPIDFRIIGDLKLIRGSSSAKNDILTFIPTTIDFSILDPNLVITKKMQAKSEKNFQAVLLKNGVAMFTGNILNLYSKRIFTQENGKVPLKIYDGITRLKDYSDLTLLPDGIASIAEIVRSIVNTLGFGLDYKYYLNMYPTPNNSAIAPAGSVGAKIIDLVNQDSNISYYSLLEKILKQFALSLYQEDGYWILRQDISLNTTGTAVSLVSAAAGTITEHSEVTVQNITRDNIQFAPQAYYLEPVSKLILRVESKSPKSDAGDIGWKNEHFREGSRGWTIEPNTTVEFQNESMRFFNSLTSGRVYQTTTHQFSPDEIAIIKFLCISCRFMQSISDEGSYPFISVRYINDEDIVFWLNENGTWTETTNPNYFVAIQERRYITNVSSYESLSGYSNVILEKEIEAPITLAMGFGYITVFLHGGGIPVYNHPYELTAQHILCSVRRKSSDDEIVKSADSLDVTSSISAEKELMVSLPMHDEDPFITPSLYNLYDGTKTRYWMPENKSLLEYLSAELLRYMSHNVEVLDMKLLPELQYGFTYLKRGNLTGSERLYLPTYEEHQLTADNRRMVMVERTKKTLTIKTTKEYFVS